MPDFTSPLDAALRYAAIGWPVFPCGPNKHPIVPSSEGGRGFLDATTDQAQIVSWWRRWPSAQVAVACGAAGLAVIDLDMGDGKDGIALFSRMHDENGAHGCGLIATTPRGGRHYVYLMPDPPIRCGTDVAGKGSGIDVRADGGYIVLPSPASPGREWMVGDPFGHDHEGESDLAPMVDWVRKLAAPRTAGASTATAGDSGTALEIQPAQVEAIRRALRHVDPNPRDVWIRVGMALKSTGGRGQAYALWCEWSATSPKFDENVQAKQWASLREYFHDGHEVTVATIFHLAMEGGWVPTGSDVGLAEPLAVASEPVEPATPHPKRPFPRDLMNVPGLVGDIAAWMLSCSTRQQPALCLASAIVTMGAVLGRRVATPTDLRTNVYFLGIGETACGKDPGVRLPRLLLTRAKMPRLVGPGEWKSDSGLRAALQDAPSHAAYCDEFTKLLDGMSGRNAPAHLKGIKRYLLELWAASNSVHLSPAYANRQINKPVEIEQPNLCLYGTGVPAELFSSLDRGAVADGFLNRMLVVFSDDQMPARQKVGRAEPPADLVQRLEAVVRATEVGELADVPGAQPNARMVPMDTEAEAMLADLEVENDARILRLRTAGEPLSDLWVRMGAHVAKLALIRAVSDDPGRTIQVGDVAWSRDLVVWCLERTMAEAEARMSDSAQEAQTKRVLRIVCDAGPSGITANHLTRRTQWLRRSERKDVLLTLLEGGDITSSTHEVAREGRGPVALVRYYGAKFQGGDG